MSRIQGKTISDGAPVYAGVDVSKATLDLHVLAPEGGGFARRFANTPEGIAALLGCLGPGRCQVAFEPTGRFHLGLWQTLHEAGHGAAPYNPYRARRFAEADGKQAKTDAIDARVLARAAARMELPALPPPPPNLLRIKELHSLRLGVVGSLRAARNRKAAAGDALARRLIDEQIALFEAQRDTIDTELARSIADDPALARRRDILISIPGIGPASTAALIADLPELGQLGDKQVAALAGLAPMNDDSGKRNGKRRIKGGRTRLRAALHMPALAAARANPDLKACRDRLKALGKSAKIINTAVLRKLVILANALVRDDRLWAPLKP